LLDEQSVGWVFYGKNSILIVGATSELLSEKVVGKSIDSEVAFFSSSHA